MNKLIDHFQGRPIVAQRGSLTVTRLGAYLGAAALWSSQPRHVWYPLLLIGGASALVGFVVLPGVRRRYAADELRRIQAMDVGRHP